MGADADALNILHAYVIVNLATPLWVGRPAGEPRRHDQKREHVPRARRRRRRGMDKDDLGERGEEPHKLVEDDRRLAVGRAQPRLGLARAGHLLKERTRALGRDRLRAVQCMRLRQDKILLSKTRSAVR